MELRGQYKLLYFSCLLPNVFKFLPIFCGRQGMWMLDPWSLEFTISPFPKPISTTKCILWGKVFNIFALIFLSDRDDNCHLIAVFWKINEILPIKNAKHCLALRRHEKNIVILNSKNMQCISQCIVIVRK